MASPVAVARPERPAPRRPAARAVPDAPPRAPAAPGVRPLPEAPRPAVARLGRLGASRRSLPAGLPRRVAEVVRSPGGGASLLPALRERLERTLGFDLAEVRVHAGPRAAAAARQLGARAFAYGTDVFLGARERADDVRLMAHEVAHVVQQRHGPAVQLRANRPPAADPLEREADSVAQAAGQGHTATVVGHAGARPQLQAEAFTGVVQDPGEGLSGGFLWVVEQVAPDLAPILRQGVGNWLRERVATALHELFETVMRPVREVTGFIGTLRGHFGNLMAWIQEAAAGIAKGDCSSISRAAERIQQVVEGLAAPVIDRIKALAERVKGFFTDLWNRVGAPVWDFLRSVGGAVWDRIQRFGAWLWEKTRAVRETLAAAWDWLKDQLGIGEGAEGQNGILQWVQRKAGAAFDWLKSHLEPYRRQIAVVAGVLVMLSPAGPVIAIGAAVGGLIYGARWLARRLSSPGAVVQDRGELERGVIPRILGAVDGVSNALQGIANTLVDRLNGVVSGLGSAVGALAGGVLRFLAGAARWLLERFRELATWASEQVRALAGWVRGALERLRAFIQPVLDTVRGIGRAMANILNVVSLVAQRAWNLIPACIRDPVVRFLTDQILRRIPLFAALLDIPDIWARIRGVVNRVIAQVFRGGDLAGAAMTVFRFLLDVLNIPVQLVRGIFAKAASVMDLILRNPVGFLRNVLGALRAGLGGFLSRIGRHLLSGVMNWLFGQLGQAGIQVPADFTVGSIFRLLLDVLGITLDRVFGVLGRKLGSAVAARMRHVLRLLTGAWEFVSALIAEGPPGLWRYLRERLSNLFDVVRDAVVGWITREIVEKVTAKLISMLDPTGIMAVVNSIIAVYRAIQSAIEYLRQMLEIFDRFLDTLGDVVRGSITAAGGKLEDLLARALPVAIGFLANQAGLGRIGTRVREIIGRVQDRVLQAIEWIVDQALRIGRAILDRVMSMAGLGPGPTPGATTEQRVRQGVEAGVAIANRFAGRPVAGAVLRPLLAATRLRFGLSRLDVVPEGEFWAVEGTGSDGVKITSAAKRDVSTPDPASAERPPLGEGEFVTVAYPPPGEPAKGRVIEVRQDNGIWFIYYTRKGGALEPYARTGSGTVRARAYHPGTSQKAWASTEDKGAYEFKRAFSGDPRRPESSFVVPLQEVPYTAAYGAPGGWWRLRAGLRNRGDWVQAHLVNGKWGGTGASNNLVPAPRAINSAMLTGHETTIHSLIGTLAVRVPREFLWFRAKVKWYADDDSVGYKKRSDFAERVDVEWGPAATADGQSWQLGFPTDRGGPYTIPPPTVYDLESNRLDG